MSAELLNLRQARKRRLREDKAKKGEENRIAFGRTKAEKNLTQALNRKHKNTLDGKRLDSASKSSRSIPDESGK